MFVALTVRLANVATPLASVFWVSVPPKVAAPTREIVTGTLGDGLLFTSNASIVTAGVIVA